MEDKSAIERTFDFLKAKGILTKYRTFEDFDKRNDYKDKDNKEEVKEKKVVLKQNGLL